MDQFSTVSKLHLIFPIEKKVEFIDYIRQAKKRSDSSLFCLVELPTSEKIDARKKCVKSQTSHLQ